MGNNHDYIALDWVKGEIKQTLSQAQIALEAYVENKEDTPQITFCLNYIHQVHGTLQMVEFYGAALLAEEMEKLCQALIEDKVASLQEALEVLMDSLLQLENYLEHIQKGQRDLPVVLLPILNDLRALQGQPLLSDTSLFTPDLSAAAITPDIAHNQRMQDEQVIANLRKLRQMFQFSLAGVIRNQDLAENFSYLYKVVSRLEKFCQGTPIGKIWWVAVGFLDAIRGDEEGISSATKQLLRELDHQIKLMIDEPQTILAKPLPTDLLKNLLYYVAKSAIDSQRIQELKASFSLAQALPSEQEVDAEREKLHRPGAETMSSVVEVLSEELSHVKEQLDLYVRDDDKDNTQLLELVPQLTQIANTMAVLGLGVARKLVLEQISRIEEIAESSEPASDQVLMDMAGALLYVEANLSSLSDAREQSEEEQNEFVVPAEHFESAHNAVIYESRNGLEQAKNSIVNFIASQWDHAEIEDVPDLLDSIRGGLQIIPLTQAAKLLESCSTYIRDSLLSDKHIPDWQQLDRLADAITSIEYYMERLSEGAQDNDGILKVAEESVSKLGFPTHETTEESSPVLSQHHISDVASESPDSIEKESDEGLIDEDILEIFMEEVAEVMDEIQVAMAQLRATPEDQAALQNLRRAFHTLKGSGRLVGAKVIAEIAWPIENLLNKHLDAAMSLEMEVFDLLDSVIEKLPELTEDFSQQRESTQYEHLISRADMLSGNETRVVHKTMSPATSKSSAEEQTGSEATETQSASEPALPSDSLEPETESSPETNNEAAAEAEQEEDIQDSWDDDEDDLIDDEILEIFIEEAGEVLEAIDTHLPTYLAAHDDQDSLTELRRAFHTLKGSGRMVNANIIGEAAWAIENLLNRIIDGSVMMNESIAELIQLVVDNIPKLIECFEKRQRPDFDLKRVENHAAALVAGDFVKPLGSLQRSSQETSAASGATEAPSAEQGTVGIDDTLLDIFRNEATSHVATVLEFVDRAANDSIDIDDDLSRALHTLKGSANTANIRPIAEIAVPVEQFIKEARANNIQADQDIASMLSDAMHFIQQGISQLDNNPDGQLSGTDEFLSGLKSLQSKVFSAQSDELQSLEEASQDPQIINIFLTEGLDILLDAESILNQWEHSPVSVNELTKLYGEVKTLHRGAKVAGLENIAELCECLESCYGSIDIENDRPSPVFVNDIKRGHEALIDMMDQLAAGLTLNLDNKLLAELREHIADHSHVIEDSPVESQSVSTQEDSLNEKLDQLEKELDDVLPTYSATTDEVEEEASVELDDEAIMDADLAEIFLEEANELVNGINPALDKLKQQPGNEHVILQLQRDMHTLKGGARLAGFEAVGDLSDILEKLFEKLIDYKADASSLMLSLLEESSQALEAMLKSIQALQPCQPQDELVTNITSIVDDLRVNTPLVEEDIAPENEQPSESQTTSPSQVLLDLDPELAEIFLEEAQEIIDSSGELLHQWESDVFNIEVVGELQRELHTLKGGARMAEINPIGDLAHELETLFESIVNKQLDATQDMTALCLSCHDALANMVEAVQQGSAINGADELLNKIKQVTTGSPVETSEPEELEIKSPVETPVEEPESIEVSAPTTIDEDDLEADLLPLFIDESKDILSAAAEYLEHWREDEDFIEGIVELQREMHTLKGGARLADVDPIGDLAEAVNTRLEQMIDGQLNDPEGLY
ncbi:Hpt domain-containing protein, partial [Oleiphilus sp. HI0128]